MCSVIEISDQTHRYSTHDIARARPANSQLFHTAIQHKRQTMDEN